MKGRIDSLQTLRFIAFTCIFICHCELLDAAGDVGVAIFFVLSGFVLTYCYYDRDFTLITALSKIGKLYPLHIITMLMAAIGLIVIGNTGYLFRRILAHLFLLQSWFPTKKIFISLNAVAWYLSTCAFLYVMFPFILKQLKRLEGKKNRIVIFSMIGAYAIQLLLGIGGNQLTAITNITDYFPYFIKWLTYVFPIYRLFDFFIGCNLGYLFLHTKEREWENKTRGKIIFSLCELIIILALLAEVLYAEAFPEWIRHTGIYIPAVTVLIYFFAKKQGMISWILTNRITIYIGNISWAMFLIHTQIISWGCILGLIQMSKWETFVECYVVTIIVTQGYIWAHNFICKWIFAKRLEKSALKAMN